MTFDWLVDWLVCVSEPTLHKKLDHVLQLLQTYHRDEMTRGFSDLIARLCVSESVDVVS